ncbi:MAG: exonuclease SbcCD subunit D [Hominimerdicola sp.]
MKFVHLSDLHIGKRLMGYSLIDDQRYILNEILEIIDNTNADGIIIAGDIFDKSIPPIEGVTLFDEFLCEIVKRNLPVFVISGNHDSPERLSFGAKIMSASNVFVSAVFDGTMQKHTLTDNFGNINIYLLPFVKPINVRGFFSDDNIDSYDIAVKFILKNTEINENERNILVCHQFVTGAAISDSEEIVVGTLDNIDSSAFKKFDYVALGHIHNPQKIGRDEVCYCGTPLKYSFSESNHNKSVTMVEFLEKGNIKIEKYPLKPLHDLREIKGSYTELTARENYIQTCTDDYLHITLTDEEDIPNAVEKLRSIYPNIMKLDYDNSRTRNIFLGETPQEVNLKTPLELFQDFYKEQNGTSISEEQLDFVRKFAEEIWGENS